MGLLVFLLFTLFTLSTAPYLCGFQRKQCIVYRCLSCLQFVKFLLKSLIISKVFKSCLYLPKRHRNNVNKKNATFFKPAHKCTKTGL